MLQKEQDLIAQDIVRCAREVYIILGNGFQEIVYKRALSAEMLLRKIEHQRGYKVPKPAYSSISAQRVCNSTDFSIQKN